MIHFKPPSSMSVEQETHRMDNSAVGSCNTSWCYATDVGLSVISAFTSVVCICGLVGNGAVIWLVGFCIKRNPFTTYILNLAVADFGVLLASIPRAGLHILRKHLSDYYIFHFLSLELFYFAYSMSQFLLTAISTDRCVSVLFPIWYRCHRPEKLSAILCGLLWLLSFLIQGICFAVGITKKCISPLFYAFLVNAVVCLPLITVSTLILFVRFCLNSQQQHRGKLLMVVLLTLVFFLIFAFPLNVIYLIKFNPNTSPTHCLNIKSYNITEYGLLCASLNSFVNPLLYFFIGRKKRSFCRENLRFILQRVFLEEEETCEGETETQQ